jgi:hypothetical protein
MKPPAIRDVIRNTERFAIAPASGRDDDGDGIREVHCNTCEGAGAGLRTYLRVFRGVHKANLHLYVATYEALVNTKRVTATLIRRICFGDPSAHASYT